VDDGSLARRDERRLIWFAGGSHRPWWALRRVEYFVVIWDGDMAFLDPPALELHECE
jgi:hypothetical protein